MNPGINRWQQIDSLAQAAFELEQGERGAFLDQACAGDEELRREVEALLSQENEAKGFIETPALELFAREIVADQAVALVGERIGHYQIEKVLGEGGMGKVFLAWDTRLARKVALKVLPPEFTRNTERVRRFEQEAHAASALNHPNIITIHEIGYDIGQHGELYFIVTELIEGKTLRQLMADSPLDTKEIINIASQIASALKAAHTAWIIHRDIKPENIMVRADGLVKVLDFGIAKLSEEMFEALPSGESTDQRNTLLEGGITNFNLTYSGMIIGTVSYMSPEQVRGEPLDGRTDLFSLGGVLHEMVTGQRLFAGETRASVLQSLLSPHEPLPSAAKFNGAPKELENIIRRCLRRMREERYASASELLNDLQKLQLQFETKTIRRMTRISALVATLALLAVFSAAWMSVSEVWEERILRDGHTAGVRHAVFSPDGRLLVSVGEDNQVIVWDFARRERLKTLTDHTSWVSSVAFSPNGEWFATGSFDHTVIVWDAAKLIKAAVLSDHRAAVSGVAFSPDGKYLASASMKPDERTALWRVGSWEKARDLPLVGGDWSPLLFSPSSPRLLSNAKAVCDVEIGQRVNGLLYPGGSGAAFSPNGSWLVTVDGNGGVNFFDSARQKTLYKPLIHHDHGRAAAFSPDGKLVATGADDIALWNVATQELITHWDYSSYIWGLTFSPDGRYLVSTHGDGSILLWDMIARNRAANLSQHSLPVGAVAFSPDGQRIASGSEDRSVIVWNAATHRKEAVLLGHRSRINALAFGPDGRWLASQGQDGELIRWDIATHQPRWRNQEGDFQSLAISPDGRLIANSAGVLDSETGWDPLESTCRHASLSIL